jgi:CRISPR-associated protein Csd1
MILQKLIELQEREDAKHESTPKMYQETPIHWVIALDKTGGYLNIIPTMQQDERGRLRPKKFVAPTVMKSVNVKANLLLGNGEYVLGIPRENSKPERVADCHRSFIDLTKECLEGTRESRIHAVLTFLESMPYIELPKEFNPDNNITFQVDGEIVFNIPSVRLFWADKCAISGDAMQCLLCGKPKPPLKRLQIKIKNIPAGQPSGMAVISANSPAFESYGLEASLIAPTCEDCGERFSKGLNYLLNTEKHYLTVGSLKYVFWTKEESDFNVRNLLDEPDPLEVKSLIESVFSGKKGALSLDINPFYGAAVSASGGRVVFRDWIDTTVGHVRENLAMFFHLGNIIDSGSDIRRPLGIFRLCAAAVFDVRQHLPAHIPKSLISFALKGGSLPYWLLGLALERNKAENSVPRNRAVLIKLTYLANLNDNTKEDYMVSLEMENKEPAYLCGRLLAVLESIQYHALGKVGATIVDRFYGTASSAPASVFGNLMKGSQAHLSKLRKEKPGLQHNLQVELQSVLQNLTGFPKTLGMQGQALFALGYYHQRAAHFSGRKEEPQEVVNDNQSSPNQ